jgi:hypothetical protein
MYSEPLGIYAMSFRSFLTSHDHINIFRCFYAIFDLCLLISDWSLHQWTIYAFPIPWYTYPMCFQPCPTFLSLYLSLHLLMFQCFVFLIVDRFHWFQCCYTFGLWSLQTISHIWTLWHHFNPSNVTTTYTLPTTVFLDLVPWTSTSTHCVLPHYTVFFWLFFVLACILSVSFWSRSFFHYLHRTAYTKTLIHSFIHIPLSDHYWARYHPFTTSLHHTLTRNWFTSTFTTFRSL